MTEPQGPPPGWQHEPARPGGHPGGAPGWQRAPQPAPPPAGQAPQRRRPGRFWYWVAGGIAALGLLAGVVSGAYAAQSAARVSRDVQQLDPQLRPLPFGVPAPVTLDAGTDWAVYVASSGRVPRVSCGGDGLAVSQPERDVSTTRDGVTWHQVLLVRPTEPGRQLIVCTSPDRTARFAVGRAVDSAALRRVGNGLLGAAAGLLGAFALAGAGILAGGVLALVVALRRNRA